jgi:DNA-binding transcriptional MerR regulator
MTRDRHEPTDAASPSASSSTVGDPSLDAPDAALAAAVADDGSAPFDLDGLATEVGATRALLEALERAGLLLPHHVDADGVARFSSADAQAIRAGMTLLDAGLPLGELLELARRTNAAVADIASPAVDAFLRFVRDPVRGTAGSDAEAAERLVTAYQRMLPATETLVAHHLRRTLLTTAASRVAEELGHDDHTASPSSAPPGGPRPSTGTDAADPMTPGTVE